MSTRHKKSSSRVKSAGLILDAGDRCVFKDGVDIHLTNKECALLEILMRNPGKVLTRAVLMKKVWDTDYLGDTRTLDVHICWIRKKIEENPRQPVRVRTVRGVGYLFDASTQ